MGYGEQQMKDLETTINNVDCEAVLIGTPINLQRFINIKKPATRASYAMSDAGKNELRTILKKKGLL
jgi:predicted GTPase